MIYEGQGGTEISGSLAHIGCDDIDGKFKIRQQA